MRLLARNLADLAGNTNVMENRSSLAEIGHAFFSMTRRLANKICIRELACAGENLAGTLLFRNKLDAQLDNRLSLVFSCT